MIFVTVGTTRFDRLIREVDRLTKAGALGPEVRCQIGSGTYEPGCCAYYRYKTSLSEDLDAADLVITHGGYTVFEAIWRRKPMLAVANTELAGDHQSKFLGALAEEVPIVWTRDPNAITELLPRARRRTMGEWQPPSLAGELDHYLHGLRGD